MYYYAISNLLYGSGTIYSKADNENRDRTYANDDKLVKNVIKKKTFIIANRKRQLQFRGQIMWKTSLKNPRKFTSLTSV